MPTFEITSPDGRKFRVEGPEGSTEAQALEKVKSKAASEPARAESWSDVPGAALKNLPASAAQFGHDIIQPIVHPIETAEGLGNLGAGVLQKFGQLPPAVGSIASAAVPGAGLLQTAGKLSGTDKTKYADAVGGFFKDRYGGADAIKNTLATDPVGAFADAATVLSGGEAALARAPGVLGKAGRIAGTASRAVDPLSIPIKAAEFAGKGAAEVIGGLGTHTGPESIKRAFGAGREGGEAGEAFQESLRGTAPLDQVVTEARGAVDKIRQERGKEYRANKAAVDADPAVLNFDKVDDALAKMSGVAVYKGQSLSPTTQGIRKEIGEAIRDWKALPASEFHTVEGMDALKRKIGDIRDGTEYGSPSRLVADQAYNAVKQTIVDQAPAYAKVMKGYEEASTQIKELEKTLSLNKNASIDTALRKLQSTLRDNVNTNFGQRKKFAEFLVEHGAPNLMEKLAGQALHPWTPRGLGKMVGTEILAASAGALGAGVAGAGLGGAGALLAMSPRLMGEGAYYAGKASNLPGRAAGRASYQAGRETPLQDPLAAGSGSPLAGSNP